MSFKVPIKFDRYLLYHEIEKYLKATAEEYPDLCTLESIGESYEGRSIWALTITAASKGKPCEKPAIYVDGNIHAGEVTGSMAALYLIDYLVDNYGKDEEVTHLVDRVTFYVIPRVSPDGAELYLTTPHTLRSSVRVWPDEEEEDPPGLHREDINGDGKILQMRVRDDRKGEWKVSSLDPRLMVPRRPGERKGPFYRIYPEGLIADYEGEPVQMQRGPYGLDLNRNFPSNWDPKVPGGGDFPASEPEVHALVKFVNAHPNIGAIHALHTYGGFFFRNPCQYQEGEMDPLDLKATREIAGEGTRGTGYPDIKSSNRATMTEWAYEHKGIIAYTTELWDRYGKAGLGFAGSMREQDPGKREEIGAKLLTWNDRELAGKGFIDWTPFDHPQLGKVEIGGWDGKFCVQNAPPRFLEQECHKNCLWVMAHASALPWVQVSELKVESLGERSREVTVVVENWGYLPTNITNKAKGLGVLKEDFVRIIPGTGLKVRGKPVKRVEYIEGYLTGGWSPARSTVQVSFTVDVLQEQGPLVLTAEYVSQRGGVSRREFTLD